MNPRLHEDLLGERERLGVVQTERTEQCEKYIFVRKKSLTAYNKYAVSQIF